MTHAPMVFIHPPVVKPSEPPAGIARLSGALRSHGLECGAIDANLDGLFYLLQRTIPPDDTWSRRAKRHLEDHLAALQSPETYTIPDRYRRAVADIGRLVAKAGEADGIRAGLGNYEDTQLSPVRSDHLLAAAASPQDNLFYCYYQSVLMPRILKLSPRTVGISINYLSQALCAFALIGMIRKADSRIRIVLGGGLVTSWLTRPGWTHPFGGLVDRMVAGPGEKAIFEEAGLKPTPQAFLPDYRDFYDKPYLSPGFVLPFSAADGCWWCRCTFCPEYTEQKPYRPLSLPLVLSQLGQLIRQTQPTLIHLLDNAVSPALLKGLAASPPGVPWYGFTRMAAPLDDREFCRRLADSGCVMLKLGLESGDQQVLDALGKGVRLGEASRILQNLYHAGITTYVYLLFGTPAEDETAAYKSLQFTVDHSQFIGFLNVAIFNLPPGSSANSALELRDFYPGDLALYHNFKHPKGWQRSIVRRFIEKKFRKHPLIQPILRRDPPVFTSNHAPFFSRHHSRLPRG